MNRSASRSLAAFLAVLAAAAAPALAVAGPAPEAAAEPGCDVAPAEDLTVLTPFDQVTDGLSCWGKIRPGVRMSSPAWCTMSWVFRDGAGAYYISTAGHCATEGRRVSADGVGEFGTVVYRVSGGVGDDFGLVKVDAAKAHLVDPTLCHWGGPVSLWEPGDDLDVVLYQYGMGTQTYSVNALHPRVFEFHGAPQSRIQYVGLSSGGDSGSPVMTASGEALGVHTHTSANVGGVGIKYGTTVAFALERAESALGVDLTLVPGERPPMTGDLLAPLT